MSNKQSPQTGQIAPSQANPWAGLASYEDPAKAEHQLKFCGRDDDSYDVAKLIMGNIFVTLYGKSGIGKTSLLNAGVFPELREEQYTPLSLRLGVRDEVHPQSYQSMIVEAVERNVKRVEVIDVIAEQKDEQAADYLWNYFARRRFFDQYDEPTTPVVVMDQFEEIFRCHRDEAEMLLRQLDYLNDRDHRLDNCTLDGESYRYEHNFRFVVSIREDDLYRLEDSIDNCLVPALKRCRYRLRSLSEQGARDAILIPGKGLFLPEEKDEVVKAIIEKSKNADGSISTNIISLLCSRIFVDFQQSKAEHITKSLVESFIKGNPFEQFYNEAIRGFSNREKSYIEDHLVDSTGRRNSIPEGDFLRYVKRGAVLMDGSRRILQRTNTSSDGGNYRIELIHDSFCAPLEGIKQRRNRRRMILSASSIVLAVVVFIAAFSYVLSINNTNKILEKGLAIIRVEKANLQIDAGDSYLARTLLCHTILSHANSNELFLYTNAEQVLRRACLHETAILRGHKDRVVNVAFSPDGKQLATCSNDSSIIIWDALSGKQLFTFLGHHDKVACVSFSPDGGKIASAGCVYTIRIWDTKTGDVLDVLNVPDPQVNAVGFSHDGMQLFYAGSETLQIINLSNNEKTELIGHQGTIDYAEYSHDGSKIISASDDGSIRIWNARNGQLLKTIAPSADKVFISAVLSPDEKYIALIDYSEGISLWDAHTGILLKSFESQYLIYRIAYSPDGKRIAVSGALNGIMILNARDLTVDQTINTLGISTGVAFSPDGEKVAYSCLDMTTRIWELRSDGEQSAIICDGKDHYMADYSPDGKQVAVANADGSITIWDLANKQEIVCFNAHDKSVVRLMYSYDGKFLLSSGYDNVVKAWDTENWQNIGSLNENEGSVFAMKLSHDQKYIATAGEDKCIRIWDMNTGKQLHVLQGSQSSIVQIDFSPNDRFIASVSSQGLMVHEISSHQEVFTINDGSDCAEVCYSPDGKLIACASYDNIIWLRDAENGKLVKQLKGHSGPVFHLSFSPDGKHLASSSWDMMIRAWNVETGQQVANFAGHTREAYSVRFSPNGQQLVSVGDDQTVRFWEFPPLCQLIDETYERFQNRELTPGEQQQFLLE